MKKILTAIAILITTSAYAQVPRFAKYEIGTTGCSAYFPVEPVFDISLSQDSSLVYTAEVTVDSFYFGIICVQLKEPIGTDKDDNVDLLKSYLDFLKESFSVTQSTGYGEGHTLETNPQAAGVIDYWKDSEGYQYQIKGWVDNNFIAVLYVTGTELPNYNVATLFLDGFRFPE